MQEVIVVILKFIAMYVAAFLFWLYCTSSKKKK